MAVPKGKRCAAAVAVVSPPPPPPPPLGSIPAPSLSAAAAAPGGLWCSPHPELGVPPAGSARPLGGGQLRPEAPRRAVRGAVVSAGARRLFFGLPGQGQTRWHLPAFGRRAEEAKAIFTG